MDPSRATVAVYRRQASTVHIVTAWIVTILTAFYMLPWAIAATRSKRNTGVIVLVNVLLGWTLIGWIVALVMACLNDSQPTVGSYAYPPQQPQYQQYRPAQPYALAQPPVPLGPAPSQPQPQLGYQQPASLAHPVPKPSVRPPSRPPSPESQPELQREEPPSPPPVAAVQPQAGAPSLPQSQPELQREEPPSPPRVAPIQPQDGAPMVIEWYSPPSPQSGHDQPTR